jgi:hypothetical protein
VRRLMIVLSVGVVTAMVVVAGAASTIAQIGQDKEAQKAAKQQQKQLSNSQRRLSNSKRRLSRSSRCLLLVVSPQVLLRSIHWALAPWSFSVARSWSVGP